MSDSIMTTLAFVIGLGLMLAYAMKVGHELRRARSRAKALDPPDKPDLPRISVTTELKPRVLVKVG